MIRKSAKRFSEKIMLKQQAQARWRFARQSHSRFSVALADKKSAPGNRGAFLVSEIGSRSGGGLLGGALDHLRSRGGARDRNRPRLHRLRNLAHEVDMKQAVLERGVLHHDEIGELERALESAGGDAAIEQLGLVAAVPAGRFLAL